MKRSSAYYPLKYRVDCKPNGQAFYETIAAFNSDRIALLYAKDCRTANKGTHEYRCMRRVGSLWVEMTTEDGK